VFPFWNGAGARLATASRQASARVATTVGKQAGKLEFRVAVAVLLAAFQLAMIAKAGHDRLGVPFNSAPGEPPYYSNPKASVLGGYPRQPHHWSRLVVSRWDAEVYISFALRGLSACPEHPLPGDPRWTDQKYMECGLAWFPTYGLIAGEIASPFDLPVDIVLMVMSILAAIAVNLLWTSKTISERIGLRDAYATLLAFNIYPSAFHLVTPYTEAATLALALGGFVCLANERWIVAGLLVGAATGLRAGAVTFAPAFGAAALVAAWRWKQAGRPQWWRPLVAAPLAGWGVIAQFVSLQILVGDWRAYLRARHMFGDERDYSRLFDGEFYLRGFGAQHMDSVMLIFGIVIVALAVRELLKRFPLEQATFLVVASLAGVVLGVAALHQYWGLNRYLLVCPLLFLSAGWIARRHTAVFVIWLVLCALVYWHVELCSFVAHGRDAYCPCLGKLEWWAPFQS
jgi:hypothetical protein